MDIMTQVTDLNKKATELANIKESIIPELREIANKLKGKNGYNDVLENIFNILRMTHPDYKEQIEDILKPQLKRYDVSLYVLEVNHYAVEVDAASEEEALALVRDNCFSAPKGYYSGFGDNTDHLPLYDYRFNEYGVGSFYSSIAKMTEEVYSAAVDKIVNVQVEGEIK